MKALHHILEKNQQAKVMEVLRDRIGKCDV
jgi:hypothetical protein